jgi:hypothetical protein
VSLDDASGKKRKYEAATVRSVRLDRLPAGLREELLSLASDSCPFQFGDDVYGALCSTMTRWQRVRPSKNLERTVVLC